MWNIEIILPLTSVYESKGKAEITGWLLGQGFSQGRNAGYAVFQSVSLDYEYMKNLNT